MNIKETDSTLINNCISGNRSAQELLYNTYSKAMYNICRRMIINDEEAQDVLQNSFIDIFTKLKMFKFESTPGAWIKRIVVNNCINHLRSRKLIIKELNFDYEIADCHDDDIELNVTVIYNAIGLLPEGYRVVFNLYAVEGYDHGEISEILNISESTSKSQYSRAKSKLYDILRTSGNLNNIYS